MEICKIFPIRFQETQKNQYENKTSTSIIRCSKWLPSNYHPTGNISLGWKKERKCWKKSSKKKIITIPPRSQNQTQQTKKIIMTRKEKPYPKKILNDILFTKASYSYSQRIDGKKGTKSKFHSNHQFSYICVRPFFKKYKKKIIKLQPSIWRINQKVEKKWKEKKKFLGFSSKTQKNFVSKKKLYEIRTKLNFLFHFPTRIKRKSCSFLRGNT